MDYDTINLLGLQPTDVHDIHIVSSIDAIYINRIMYCINKDSLPNYTSTKKTNKTYKNNY